MNAVLVAGSIWLVATGVGAMLSVRLSGGRWRRAEALLFGSAIGLGAVAYLVWMIGLFGLLTKTALMLCGTVLIPPSVVGWIMLLRHPSADTCLQDERSPAWLIVPFLVLCGLAFAVPLVDCFVPPAAHEWDSLSYHLAVPKTYLREQRIVELPTDHHSYFPFLTQMLFTTALAFDGFAAAKLVHWMFGVLTCAATFLLARRIMPPAGAYLAAVVFALTPMVMWEAGIAYIELAQAFFLVLLFLSLLMMHQDGRPASAAAAGISAGLALAVKTISLVPVTAAAIVALVHQRRLRALLTMLILAAAVGAPFYLRTWMLTGNPVYPFAYSVFGGKHWDAERARLYAGEHTSFGLDARLPALSDDLQPTRPTYAEPSIGDRLRNLALAPFALVAMPRVFHNYNDPSPYMNLGFLWLALLPLATLRRPMDAKIGVLLWALAFWYVTWSLSMQYARYLIPAVPLLAVVGSWGVVWFASRSRIALGAAAVAVLIQAVVLGAHALPRAAAQARLAVSYDAAQTHLARQVNVYRSQQWLNAHTRSHEGVVLFEETRGFYLDRPVLWGNAPHSAYIPYGSFRSGRDMAAWFIRQGFPYALVNLQFAPQAATEEGAEMLRTAVGNGSEASLLVRWYADASAPSDHWRRLIGDAVTTGAARLVAEGSERGAVVLRFQAVKDTDL